MHNLTKILLIDIKKAFDTIERKILQDKINQLPLKLYNNINIEIEYAALHP